MRTFAGYTGDMADKDSRRNKLRLASRILLGALFIGAGAMHFLKTDAYVSIMPPYIPHPHFVVYESGFFEILGGIGVLTPQPLRRAAGQCLILLLIVVFPANVQIALHGATFGQTHISQLWGWLRLPLQIPLIYWVWRSAVAK